MGHLDNTPEKPNLALDALTAACMWTALVLGAALLIGVLRTSLGSL